MSRDDNRFLLIKDVSATSSRERTAPTITVVVNWTDELKARLPAR